MTSYPESQPIKATTYSRETKQAYEYLVTGLHKLFERQPTPWHCELDALAVAARLRTQACKDIQMLIITSRDPNLWHFYSVWQTNAIDPSRYDGMHYAILTQGRVLDLQSTLIDLPLEFYLRQSFPSQTISYKMASPDLVRTTLQTSPQFQNARHNNYHGFEELLPDQTLQAPQSRTKPLSEIIKRKP